MKEKTLPALNVAFFGRFDAVTVASGVGGVTTKSSGSPSFTSYVLPNPEPLGPVAPVAPCAPRGR